MNQFPNVEMFIQSDQNSKSEYFIYYITVESCQELLVNGPRHLSDFSLLLAIVRNVLSSFYDYRYTYRCLRTDLRKILSIWPFENSTTVLLVHKVKSKN